MAEAGQYERGDRAIAHSQCVGSDRAAAADMAEARTAAAGTIEVVVARFWRFGGAAEPHQRGDTPLALAEMEPTVEPGDQQAWPPLRR